MDKLIAFIEEILKSTGYNEETSLAMIIFVVLFMLLFTYLLKQYNEKMIREDALIKDTLITYNDVITSIFEYRDSKISRNQLYIEILSLLPLCSHHLQSLILGFKDSESNISEEELNYRMRSLCESIIHEFKQLRYRDSTSVSNKFSNNTINKIEHSFRNSGLHSIFFSLILSTLSFVLFFLLLLFTDLLSRKSEVSERIFLIIILWFITIYLLMVIIFLDTFNTSASKKKPFWIFLAVLNFILPLITFYIKSKFITVILFAIFILFSFFIIKNMTSKKW